MRWRLLATRFFFFEGGGVDLIRWVRGTGYLRGCGLASPLHTHKLSQLSPLVGFLLRLPRVGVGAGARSRSSPEFVRSGEDSPNSLL
jgi:hypothetical protein